MIKDNVQLLRNPDIEPTETILSESLNDAYLSYQQFQDHLQEHDIDFVWRYYPDGKAWLAKGIYRWTEKRGSNKEMTLLWCSIWNGFFKIVIYIPEDKRDDVLSLSIDNDLKNVISELERMGETFRTIPIVFDIKSNELFDSVFKIIEYKKGLKK